MLLTGRLGQQSISEHSEFSDFYMRVCRNCLSCSLSLPVISSLLTDLQIYVKSCASFVITMFLIN